MQTIFNILNVPLGWVLEALAGIFGGNFAAAVFVFTIIMNLAMIPLSIKSQKSSVQQMRLKPKLDELKKKYGDDRTKYSTEMQKLYQQENVSMSGGCLPMLIRLPIMMSIYYLICSPLTYLIHISKDVITAATAQLNELGMNLAANTAELSIIESVRNGTSVAGIGADAVNKINFSFFGINLTETPHFSMNIFGDFKPIWIIPILAFVAAMLSSIISLRLQKKINPDAPNMAGMMLSMPLISLFIGFTVPGGVGFYWACSSLIAGIVQAVVQYTYGPNRIIAKENAKAIIKEYQSEQVSLKKAAERTAGSDEQ